MVEVVVEESVAIANEWSLHDFFVWNKRSHTYKIGIKKVTSQFIYCKRRMWKRNSANFILSQISFLFFQYCPCFMYCVRRNLCKTKMVVFPIIRLDLRFFHVSWTTNYRVDSVHKRLSTEQHYLYFGEYTS